MLLATIERGCLILALKRFIFYSLKREGAGGGDEGEGERGGGCMNMTHILKVLSMLVFIWRGLKTNSNSLFQSCMTRSEHMKG